VAARRNEVTPLRVLVVSLDRLSRAGLAAVLNEQPGLSVVGQISGDAKEFLPLDVYVPDVIVWDLSWETESAVVNLSLLPVDAPPVLTLAVTEGKAAQARAAATQAILSRDASPETLAAAIVALSHGL
jgi:DNA-binding NarL/FixJ family response regulator